MKNLNEPRRTDPEVVPFEPRTAAPRDTENLREMWSDIQAGFVDEPRAAVEKADKLVSSAIKQIHDRFDRERADMEKNWRRDGDVSTEDLRVCLQEYRQFFDRLISRM